MFCSVVGAFFGAYGIVPNFHKWWLMNEPAAAAAEHLSAEEAALATAGSHHNKWYLYGFVFLRIIMMGGDTFCSMERCCALLFPLKFHTSWSCPAAIGKSAAISDPPVYRRGKARVTTLGYFLAREKSRYRSL